MGLARSTAVGGGHGRGVVFHRCPCIGEKFSLDAASWECRGVCEHADVCPLDVCDCNMAKRTFLPCAYIYRILSSISGKDTLRRRKVQGRTRASSCTCLGQAVPVSPCGYLPPYTVLRVCALCM